METIAALIQDMMKRFMRIIGEVLKDKETLGKITENTTETGEQEY